MDDRMWLEGSSTVVKGCFDMSPQLTHQAKVLLFAWNDKQEEVVDMLQNIFNSQQITV